MSKLIVPQWPLPKGVAACSSTRIGGVSLPPYDSLNLGAHCGDNPDHVEENRKRLFAAGNLPSKPVWLEQVHGKDVLKLTGEPYASKRADASYSNTPGTVCRYWSVLKRISDKTSPDLWCWHVKPLTFLTRFRRKRRC